MATDRLKIYNGALLLLGETRLASLSENREPRYLLDLVWNDGGVRYCLEQAQWHFAMRATELDYNPSVEPSWGFQRAFDKPTDWVATSGVFEDEFMETPLTQYADEVSYWFADRDIIYVKYVSDGVNYGNNLAAWPATFTEYVKAYFASKIVGKLPNSATRAKMLLGEDLSGLKTGYLRAALLTAKNKAAMTKPATFPSRGTWVAARQAGFKRTYRDGGNTNSLIG